MVEVTKTTWSLSTRIIGSLFYKVMVNNVLSIVPSDFSFLQISVSTIDRTMIKAIILASSFDASGDVCS